jgi:hypothetical protein
MFRMVVLVALLAGCAPGIVSHGRIRSDLFADVLVRTERARGIAVEGEVDARAVNQNELAEIVQSAASSQWEPDEFQRYQDSLVAVGLWPAGRDLMEEYIATLGDEAAGLYVPSDRRVYVVSNPGIPFSLRITQVLMRRDLVREMSLSHELVHLLQHQAYPHLMGLEPSLKGQDDVGYAVQAAVEGDALRYGLEALELLPLLPEPDDFQRSFEGEMEGSRLAEAPAVIRLSIALPYSQGYRLAYREATGLLEAPPVSTEQTLHPNKRRESFLVFDLGGLRSQLPAGCEFVYENTVGELALSTLMTELQPVSSEAWEGWDGDRYLVSRCQGALELLWISAWDTEADALEFAASYREIAELLARASDLTTAPQVSRTGRQVVISTPRLRPLEKSLGRARRARVATLPEFYEFLDGSGE